jgi:hypothetical protein
MPLMEITGGKNWVVIIRMSDALWLWCGKRGPTGDAVSVVGIGKCTDVSGGC